MINCLSEFTPVKLTSQWASEIQCVYCASPVTTVNHERDSHCMTTFCVARPGADHQY